MSTSVADAPALGLAGRSRSARVAAMLAALGLILIASLGAHLHIAGYPTLPMPWWFVYRLPVFDYLIPSNFLLFAELLAPQQLRAFLRAHGVKQVVVSPLPGSSIWPPIFARLGWTRQRVGGVLLYTVR